MSEYQQLRERFLERMSRMPRREAEPQPEAAPRPRGALRALGDVALEASTTISDAVGDTVNLALPGNAFSRRVREGTKVLREWGLSDDLQHRQRAIEQRVAEAGPGVIDQFGAVVGAAWDDPMAYAGKAVGAAATMVPGALAARVAQAGVAARGLATQGAQRAAGMGAMASTNAAMNAGAARTQAMEQLEAEYVRQGWAPAQARAMAIRESRTPAAWGALTGLASGATGLDRLVAGGVRETATRAGLKAALGRGLRGTVVEMTGEQTEEVLPHVATNRMVALAGGERDLLADVGRVAGETLVVSSPLGAVSGALEMRHRPGLDYADLLEGEGEGWRDAAPPVRQQPPSPAEPSAFEDAPDEAPPPRRMGLPVEGAPLGAQSLAQARQDTQDAWAGQWDAWTQQARHLGAHAADATAAMATPQAAQELAERQQQALVQVRQAQVQAQEQQALAEQQALEADPVRQQAAAIFQRAHEVKQRQARVLEMAQQLGVTGRAAQQTFADAAQALEDGLIDDAQFADMAGMLAGEALRLPAVRQSLKQMRVQAQKERARAMEVQALLAQGEQPVQPEPQPQLEQPEPQAQTQLEQPEPQPEPQPAQEETTEPAAAVKPKPEQQARAEVQQAREKTTAPAATAKPQAQAEVDTEGYDIRHGQGRKLYARLKALQEHMPPEWVQKQARALEGEKPKTDAVRKALARAEADLRGEGAKAQRAQAKQAALEQARDVALGAGDGQQSVLEALIAAQRTKNRGKAMGRQQARLVARLLNVDEATGHPLGEMRAVKDVAQELGRTPEGVYKTLTNYGLSMAMLKQWRAAMDSNQMVATASDLQAQELSGQSVNRAVVENDHARNDNDDNGAGLTVRHATDSGIVYEGSSRGDAGAATARQQEKRATALAAELAQSTNARDQEIAAIAMDKHARKETSATENPVSPGATQPNTKAQERAATLEKAASDMWARFGGPLRPQWEELGADLKEQWTDAVVQWQHNVEENAYGANTVATEDVYLKAQAEGVRRAHVMTTFNHGDTRTLDDLMDEISVHPVSGAPLTPEYAAEDWADYQENTPGAVAWEDLHPIAQRELTLLVADRYADADALAEAFHDFNRLAVRSNRRKVGGMRLSLRAQSPAQRSTVAAVQEAIARVAGRSDRVQVVQRLEDLPAEVHARVKSTGQGGVIQGFVETDPVTGEDVAWLIAGHIPAGRELALFLHEVGVHIGLENLLDSEQLLELAREVAAWERTRAPGSLEHAVARRVKARLANAGMRGAAGLWEQMLDGQTQLDLNDARVLQVVSETVAYAVETAVERGVTPQAHDGLGGWIRRVMEAFRKALGAFLGNEATGDLTAQELVDLAYGAAGLAMRTRGVLDADSMHRTMQRELKRQRPTALAAARASVAPDPIAEATEEAVQQWQQRLASLAAMRNPMQGPALKTPSPAVLRAMGVKADALTLPVGYLKAIADKHRDLPAKVWQTLPAMLADPLFILPHREGGWRVFVDATTAKGEPVFVGVSEDGRVHTLSPLHDWGGKTGQQLLQRAWDQALRHGERVYARNNEALSGLAAGRASPAAAPAILALHRDSVSAANILTRSRVVNNLGKGRYRGARFSVAEREEVAQALPQGLRQAFRGASLGLQQALRDVRTRAMTLGAFTEDLAEYASRHLPSAREYLRLFNQMKASRLNAEREVDAVMQMYDGLPANEKGTGQGSVNAFLRDATLEGLWGYEPEHLPEDARQKVQVDAAMAERFAALSPQGQALVRAVFAHGWRDLQQRQQVVRETIHTEHDALIAQARASGDKKALAEAEQAKERALKHFAGLLQINHTKPYAPLGRFGDHVVVGMSEEYLAAREAGDVAAVLKMAGDAKHYFVAFRETRREARALEREVAGRYAHSRTFAKSRAERELYGGRDALGALRKLRAAVDDGAEGRTAAVNTALNRLLVDLHLSMLSETSARQSENRRAGVAGSDADMLRAFATQGRAAAHFTAALRFNEPIQQVLRKLRAEADSMRGENHEERRDLYNELVARHAMNMDYAATPTTDKLLAATSFWRLATNPSYYLINLMQVPAITVPQMAGTHGAARTWDAVMRAYKEVTALIGQHGLGQALYAHLPGDVRPLVQQLLDRGRIDILMEQELGQWRSRTDGQRDPVGKALTWLREKNQQVEQINRLVTAMAAARLELERGHDARQALAYADGMIYRTHGDYSAANAPRWMRTPTGRLLAQFRKYQLIQISLFTRLVKDSLQSLDGPERAAARRALAWQVGHAMALGGLMGIPGAHLALWAAAALFGSEGDDGEDWLQRHMGDSAAARLLVRGAPTLVGLDLSDRTAHGQMLTPLPFADPGMDRKGADSVIVAALGPAVGLARDAWTGVGKMVSGDVYRGLELLLPSGLRNVAKAWREGSEGVTKSGGDVLVSREEYDFLHATAQALGLQPQLSRRAWREDQRLRRQQEAFGQQATRMQRAWAAARESGDAQRMQALRQQWAQMNARRREAGLQPRRMTELTRSRKQTRGQDKPRQ